MQSAKGIILGADETHRKMIHNVILNCSLDAVSSDLYQTEPYKKL